MNRPLPKPVEFEGIKKRKREENERYKLVGSDRVLIVHPKTKCKGQNCCIHNPSDHHMRDWPQNWRGDRNLMERICPHGIGHPDPDDPNPDKVHGCDGCCDPNPDMNNADIAWLKETNALKAEIKSLTKDLGDSKLAFQILSDSYRALREANADLRGQISEAIQMLREYTKKP
jgi:hypothetical protein